MKGILEDGSQRSYFPTGFPFYLYSRILYDTSLTYEEIKEEYFSAAFGEDWKDFYAYLEGIEQAIDIRYLSGELSSDMEISKFYNPSLAESFAKVEAICDKAAEVVKAHYNMPSRAQTLSVRLIERHIEYCRYLAKALICKCQGKDDEARAIFKELWDAFNRYEFDMEANYDHSLCMGALNAVFNTPTNMPTGDDEPLLNVDLKPND